MLGGWGVICIQLHSLGKSPGHKDLRDISSTQVLRQKNFLWKFRTHFISRGTNILFISCVIISILGK